MSSTSTRTNLTHKHHIVPRHAGGTDDASNIIEVSPAMHAWLHKMRWETYGDKYDYLAWKGLTGQIGKDEMILEAMRENGRRWVTENVQKYCYANGQKAVESGQLAAARKIRNEAVKVDVEVTHPCGKVEVIRGYKDFCKNHGLSAGNVSKVLKGDRKHTKGFKFKKL